MTHHSHEIFKYFYECQCPHLNRGLPFRANFERAMLADIVAKYPNSQPLIYVSQGPGGCLSDVSIIAQLLAAGYNQLDLIFIEPLYETHTDVLNACLALKTWCKETTYNTGCILTPHFYTTLNAYAQACKRNAQLRGDIFITIDPDDKKTMPNFSSLSFRKKFCRLFKNIMQPQSSCYYLYFQQHNGHDYRNMVIGHCSIFDHQPLLQLTHSYGTKTLDEHRHTHVFLNSDHVYPFDLKKQLVQINDSVLTNATLAALL